MGFSISDFGTKLENKSLFGFFFGFLLKNEQMIHGFF